MAKYTIFILNNVIVNSHGQFSFDVIGPVCGLAAALTGGELNQ